MFVLNSLRNKMVALLLLFALVPLALVGFSLWQATHQQEQQGLSVYEIFARQTADAIDRNLFERYGDVQAFGLNAAVDTAELDPARVIEAMNGYVEKYGLYPLMLLTDARGTVLAVNTRNAAGRAVDSRFLIGSDMSGQAWFQRVSRGDFTTRQPYTAPGNDISDGTVIVDLYIDDFVKQTNPGHSGAVIGFAAPVERDGVVLGYWYNMADLATVEEIYEASYQRLKSVGLASSNLTLLDNTGMVIIDFNPQGSGSEQVTKTEAFMSLNLVEEGVEAAQKAVGGGTGSLYGLHSRLNEMQASGYSHLVGAMGYPGMNWSVLIRTPRDEAAAVPIGTRRILLIEAVLLVVAAIGAGLYLSGRFAAPLRQMAAVARKLTTGDLTAKVGVSSSDEIGEVGNAIDGLATYLRETVAVIEGSVQNLESAAGSAKSAVETVGASVSDTSHRARNVAAAAEELSVTMNSVSEGAASSASGLNSVATGSDEMASTIREIATSTERARGITVSAVENVHAASERVAELSTASEEINRVIDVILEIAEQTKLLALNATIEAARAGESGKGFAVVASEVKDLAQQTNKATEEIRESIAGIQASTGTTVGEIENIQEVIGEVSNIVSSIAAAVEEQSVTTQHMASNIANSADLVSEMNGSFGEVNRTSSEIASDVTEVTRSINDMETGMEMINLSATSVAELSDDLQRVVDQFRT